MSPAKYPKNSTAQHSFGFEFKLANSWQHERETCPQRDRTVDGAWISVAQVSVLCWREADRHQTPLLSLMCLPPPNNKQERLVPCPQCHLRHCITWLANNRLSPGLAQLRPISENEHMAQNALSAHRSCCFHSASLGHFEMPETNWKQQKNWVSPHRRGCHVVYQQRGKKSIHWIIPKEWNGSQLV